MTVTAAVTSALAIEAVDWARWEYRQRQARYLEMWRLAAGYKVEGSRRVLLDTRPPPVKWTQPSKEFFYGGAHTHRMSHKEFGYKYTVEPGEITATQAAALWEGANAHMKVLTDKIANEMSHQIDAIAYGLMMGTNKYGDALWTNIYEGPKQLHTFGNLPPREETYYERTGSCQNQTLTDLRRSLSDILSPEPCTSPQVAKNKEHGKPLRTPRKSTTWWPSLRVPVAKSGGRIRNRLV